MNLMDFLAEPALPLAAALWVIGTIVLKPWKKLPDELIPVILLAFGIPGAFGLMSIVGKVAITTAVIQGVLAVGVAMLANQVPKQLAKYIKK